MPYRSGNRLRIGNIAGHDVYVDLVMLGIFALFVLWGRTREEMPLGIAWLVGGFLSVLVHELGHAVAIHRYTGRHTAVVVGWGGYALLPGYVPPRHDLRISLAGPGAGFLFGGLAWLVFLVAVPDRSAWPPLVFYQGESIWILTLRSIVWLSIIWGMVNLVPARPLDGGQALRALLIIFGVTPFTARRMTRRLGMAVSGAAAIWALAGRDIFIGILALLVLFANFEEARVEGF